MSGTGNGYLRGGGRRGWGGRALMRGRVGGLTRVPGEMGGATTTILFRYEHR